MAITEWEVRRAKMGQGRIRVLLCDDDPAFRAVLSGEVERTLARLNMRAELQVYARPALVPPQQLAACDMAFLDIDFEDERHNGIDMARTLRQVNDRALIFFVTNYIEFAPAGYEVQAFRYILKRDLGAVLERYLIQGLESLAEGQMFLRLRDREQTIDLPMERITYLEVLDHSVSIHAAGECYTLSATLTAMEGALSAHGFLRIHKSYLVSVAQIRRFRSRECLLADGTVLAVSEKNYAQQKQKYLLWKGLA